MPQVLIRNLNNDTVNQLKQRAIKHGRSLEAELRTILQQSAEEETKEPSTLYEDVRALFVNRKFEDSTALIRENRDK